MRKLFVSFVFALFPALAPAYAQDVGVPPAAPLAELVALLDSDNPDLAVARRETDAAIARIQPAGAPPDPAISAGYMSGFLRPPFFPSGTTPDGGWQFGVTQPIPFPGKLAARTDLAATLAERARWDVQVRRVKLVAALKGAYADLELTERSLAILGRTRVILEQVHSHAETRFRVGRGPQQDILRAQLEISSLRERETMLRRDARNALAAINGLLGRPPATTFRTAPVAITVPPSFVALQHLAGERNPSARQVDQQVAAGQAALSLARKDVLPDFGITVTTQKKVSGMPWMYGVDVMASVPIFRKRKQQPMVAEATAMLAAARSMREATRVEADAELASASADADAARELLSLYADSILPQARLALESSLASYQTGEVDFLTLLSNVAGVQAYDIAYQQQRAQYLRALARLEPLTGLALIQ